MTLSVSEGTIWRPFTVALLILVLAVSQLFSSQLSELGTPKSITPKDGFVPTATVAIAIAEAVLIPVYGKQQIASERPFKAELSGGVWDVTGTVKCNPPGSLCPGGAAEVKISKKTGEIVFMTHYQ